MAGALDTALKNAAKAVVADLGSSLDTTITYTRKASPTYNTSTGALSTTDTAYSNIKVPIEFVNSSEEGGYQENTFQIHWQSIHDHHQVQSYIQEYPLVLLLFLLKL